MERSDADMGGEPISTGSPALDYILDGGYAKNRVHLIEGQPGSGKTTLSLQFLLDGRNNGERCLYITLSESRDELLHVAKTHGWRLDGIEIYELVPPELSLDPDREQTILYASDLELGETVKMVMERVGKSSPNRVVFDSLSEIRLLAQGALRYRRQVLALKHFFAKLHCTVLFLDDLTEAIEDLNLHSLAHGVIRLEQRAMAYGAERRSLRVYKMRARAFRGGFHDFVIRKGGLEIFPRLVANAYPVDKFDDRQAMSGIEALDSLVGGGLHYGAANLIMGPSGSGKTTLALQYIYSAMELGSSALFVSFDETRRNFSRRANGLGLNVDRFGEAFVFRQVDPAELSPGELSGMIRREVEEKGVKIIVIDSLSGLHHAMPEERFMLLQLHELLTYLNQQGALTFLTLTQSGLIGNMQSPIDLTYLSDAVLLLRFFELDGEIKRALSVMKKRTGRHETALREFSITASGIRIGPALRGFRGVMTGCPILEDKAPMAEGGGAVFKL